MEKRYCSWFGICDMPVSIYAKTYRTSIIKEALEKVDRKVFFMGDDLWVTIHAMPLAKSII